MVFVFGLQIQFEFRNCDDIIEKIFFCDHVAVWMAPTQKTENTLRDVHGAIRFSIWRTCNVPMLRSGYEF